MSLSRQLAFFCQHLANVRSPAKRYLSSRLIARQREQNAGTISNQVFSGQERIVEKLWREFFSDPSKWWDHRPGKADARYPDFKHKKTKQALWLDGKYKPPWVETELAAMASGSIQTNIFQWNTMLARCVKAGKYEKAIQLFLQILHEDLKPDSFTFVPVLNACANLRALQRGRHIHAQVIQSSCESDIYVGNSLIDMYAKCGSIEEASSVFSKLPMRNVVSWNAMILGHVKCGKGQEALVLFRQMEGEGVGPVPGTFVAVLNACASIAALQDGRRVHEQVIQLGFEFNLFVGSSLVDMYTRCGCIEEAWQVFSKMLTRDVVAWSVMILGLVKCGQSQKALELYQQMQQDGLKPDPVTFVGLLNACASLVVLEEGRQVHQQIIQFGYENDVFVGSSLIDMYAKCGSIDDAWQVFNRMPIRNVVSWNAMILGYVKSGQGQRALELSRQMHEEGVEPGPGTFVGLLNACAHVATLEEGRFVHRQIVETGCEPDVFVVSCLIDMYAKCGSIEDAERIFHEMPTPSIVAWGALLGGYAMHGHSKEALAHFELMCQGGLDIDGVIFVSLLSACSHAGLVDEGMYLFESMTSVHSITATAEHSACIVDLLGRAGRLHEADDLIKTMSVKPNAAVWMTLLGACRLHGNMEIGECIAKRALKVDPGNAASYVLLSNIYASAGKCGTEYQ